MKLLEIGNLSLVACAVIVGNSFTPVHSQELGQSEWQTPSGGGSNVSAQSAPPSQSDWQQAGGGGQQQPQVQMQQPQQQSQIQQQLFQQAQQQPQQQQFQQPQQQQQQQQQVTQSDWQTPNSSGQTLGDAMQSGTANSGNSDIDPAAAAMMMNQLKGGVSATGAGGATSNGAFNPGAMMGGGASGADPMAAMSQQFAPALNALMQVMPSNNNGMNMGAPVSSTPFTGGFAVPRRSNNVVRSNNSGGGVGSSVSKVVPPAMVQSMVRRMMYQGMSQVRF